MLFSPKEKGQGLVEYGLILVLVAVVVIAALQILGSIFDGERSYRVWQDVVRYGPLACVGFVTVFLACLSALWVWSKIDRRQF